MNSIFKVVAIIALFSVYVFSEPSIYIGGGLNISSTTATDSLDAAKTPRRGFNIAIGFEQTLTEKLSLVSGLSMETRGESTESTTDIGDESMSLLSNVKSDYNLFYLQIPLFVQFNLPLGPGKLNIFAGPEMGILLVGELQSVETSTIPSTGTVLPSVPDTLDLAKGMKMADGGVSIGIGYEVTLGRSAFFFRPSYYQGFVDYFVKSPTGVLRNIKMLVGYKYTFSK